MLYPISIRKRNIVKISCLITLSILNLQANAQQDLLKKGSTVSVTSEKVKGIVIDEDNKPVPGVNVSVPGYSAAITNDKGEFSVNVPYSNTTIVITGENYERKEVALKGRSAIRVKLHPTGSPSMYKEAVLPTSVTFKSVTPYSTETIDLENSHWEVPGTQTAGSFLQGRTSGLYVTRKSGGLNSDATVLIRGFNSLYTTNKPLIVVDGMIYDNEDYSRELIGGNINSPIANIDIKDIEDITVIKDGSSIYGTKGANGVIMVRTTHPTDLTTKMDVGVFTGFNQQPSNLPLMNSEQYRLYLSQLLETKGLSQSEVQAQPFMSSSLNLSEKNTNWQDEVMKNGYYRNAYLKVTGGDNIARYALSLGYQKNDGLIKNTDLSKYNMRLNGDVNLTKKLTLQANLSFYYNQGNLRDQGVRNKTNPLYLSLVKSPFFTVNEFAEDGSRSPNLDGTDYFNVSNPAVVVSDKAVGLNRAYRFWGNLQFGYKFNKAFDIKSILGITFDKSRENFFYPEKGLSTDTLGLAIGTNRSGGEQQRLFSLYNDTFLEFSKSYLNKHNVNARVGLRVQSNEAESDLALGFNAPTDDFFSVGAGSPLLRQVGGSLGSWNWLNSYLAVNYNFLQKYFIAVTAAADGSTRFGNQAKYGSFSLGNEKFAFMPSVAAGWLVTSENFMANVKGIDFLKLRASYGISGNDDIGNYTAKTYYVSQNLLGVQGLVRGNIGNPSLQWERVKRANAGADMALFGEKLNLSFDVFRNKTDNMLFIQDLNAYNGFDNIISNSAAMDTRGVDFSLSGRVINGKNLKWDLGLNVSHYTNEITALPVDEKITSYYRAIYLTKKGLDANVFYGLQADGIYKTNAEAVASGLSRKLSNGTVVPYSGGDVRFVDKNGDGLIDDNDRAVIGNPNPDLVGMFNAVLTYKRLVLNTLFSFSVGNDVYNSTRNSLEMMSGYENQSSATLNRWRADGQQTSIPKASWGDPMGNSQFSSRWIEDGSYLRLRTVALTYTLPVKEKMLKSAKIYLSADNLFTLTNYLGFDPEFSSSNSPFGQGVDIGMVPQYKTVQLGFRLGL